MQLIPQVPLMSKTPFDLKRIKLTEEAQACIESECQQNTELTAQAIVRDVMHEWALRKIRMATVLSGIVARRGIRRDDGGQPE